MKRFFTILVLTVGAFFSLHAMDKIDSYVYKKLIANIKEVSKPRIEGNYLIFTQNRNLRHAGIVFEFEKYKQVHNFIRLPKEREEKTRGILFYILKLPEGLSEINYRLVLDGLWTADPQNDEGFYDYTLGLSVSQVKIPFIQTYRTEVLQNGEVQFYFKGTPGECVRLAGDFNGWDPFMYELEEVRPGEYFLVLPLPSGSWVYAFFIGGQQHHDPTNHNTVFSKNGKLASKIQVD